VHRSAVCSAANIDKVIDESLRESERKIRVQLLTPQTSKQNEDELEEQLLEENMLVDDVATWEEEENPTNFIAQSDLAKRIYGNLIDDFSPFQSQDVSMNEQPMEEADISTTTKTKRRYICKENDVMSSINMNCQKEELTSQLHSIRNSLSKRMKTLQTRISYCCKLIDVNNRTSIVINEHRNKPRKMQNNVNNTNLLDIPTKVPIMDNSIANTDDSSSAQQISDLNNEIRTNVDHHLNSLITKRATLQPLEEPRYSKNENFDSILVLTIR